MAPSSARNQRARVAFSTIPIWIRSGKPRRRARRRCSSPDLGARDGRLKAYELVGAVGRVTDTTMAIARLLYSGHLLRYPEVNLVISHGGAALPMILGRLKRSFAPAPAQNSDPAPGFHKLYFNSVVYDPLAVRFISEIASPAHVLMGTDEPFAITKQQPVNLIESFQLSASDRQAILGGTAAKLFRIGNARIARSMIVRRRKRHAPCNPDSERHPRSAGGKLHAAGSVPTRADSHVSTEYRADVVGALTRRATELALAP